MEALKIEPSPKTPKVVLDAQHNQFELSGRSIPEDSVGFYQPVFDWLNQYGQNPNLETHFKFELEYFNTSSSKNILEVLKKLDSIHQAGHTVKVLWYYEEEDEDMEETGEDYKALLSVPVELIMTTE